MSGVESAFRRLVIPEPNSGCWLWLGTSRANGYGQFRREYAHRAAYRIFRCEPGRKYVLHRCDVRCCVNPDHLFLGTHADNMRDMAQKGRAPGNRKTPGHLRPRARLSPEDVATIRASDAGTVELARRYGVHRQTILRIRGGRRGRGSLYPPR